jgi:cyanophycinase
LNGVTIGGTSAGLAILGNYIFSASHDTIDSPTALADPYDYRVTIARTFLKIPFLETVLTDSHFAARDRMGRLLTFLAREVTDGTGPLPIRGLGVDETTALLLDLNTGLATTVGENCAFVCNPQAAPEKCEKNVPLTYKGIPCLRLSGPAGTVYDFNTFTGDATAIAYVNTISDGCFSATSCDAYGVPFGL